MAIWERYQGEMSLTALGDDTSRVLILNKEDTDNFQNADLVIVDGILTLHTDTDDLIGVRLLIRDEGATGLTENDPEPHHRAVYYEWFTARGPVIHRLLSKRTVPPNHNLIIQGWKASGTTSTTFRYGLRVLFQLKH